MIVAEEVAAEGGPADVGGKAAAARVAAEDGVATCPPTGAGATSAPASPTVRAANAGHTKAGTLHNYTIVLITHKDVKKKMGTRPGLIRVWRNIL